MAKVSLADLKGTQMSPNRWGKGYPELGNPKYWCIQTKCLIRNKTNISYICFLQIEKVHVLFSCDAHRHKDSYLCDQAPRAEYLFRRMSFVFKGKLKPGHRRPSLQ